MSNKNMHDDSVAEEILRRHGIGDEETEIAKGPRAKAKIDAIVRAVVAAKSGTKH